MKFNNPYLTEKEKIELLSKWIIIQSLIYYEYDFNLVSDETYDYNSKALLEFILVHPEVFKSSKYYHILHDFKGSGYYIYSRLTNEETKEYENLINYVLKLQRSKGAKKKMEKQRKIKVIFEAEPMENGELRCKAEFMGTQSELESGLLTLIVEYSRGINENPEGILARLIAAYSAVKIMDLDSDKKDFIKELSKHFRGMN